MIPPSLAVKPLRMNSIMTENKNGRLSFPAFCLGIVLILALIQAGGALRGNRIVFPDVREIGRSLIRLLGEAKTYGLIATTMLHLLEALGLSVAIGLVTGVTGSFSKRFRSLTAPFMILIRSLPMIVLVILIMTMISYDLVPLVATTAVLIPLISEAAGEGCRAIDPEMIDVYRLNSGFNITVFRRVYLPMISGYLRQAFFNAAGMGLKVTVSAEYLVQTKNSLGKAVYSSGYFLEYADIYAYAVIMILMILLITEIPAMIIKKN